MPYRDRDIVASWVAEFAEQGHAMDASVDVLEQDGTSVAETGLVVVAMRNASTVTYIQPVVRETPQWIVTFEAREHDLELDSAGVAKLAADVALVSALCAFLQAKTDAVRAADAAPGDAHPVA